MDCPAIVYIRVMLSTPFVDGIRIEAGRYLQKEVRLLLALSLHELSAVVVQPGRVVHPGRLSTFRSLLPPVRRRCQDCKPLSTHVSAASSSVEDYPGGRRGEMAGKLDVWTSVPVGSRR